MKLSEALASLLLITASGGAGAFSPHQKSSSWNRASSTSRIMMSSQSAEGGSRIPAKKVLTAADVIGKANAQGSLPGKDSATEDAPKLFTKEIYDDFQSALLKLEKRVKEGPGSLSAEEIDIFKGETDRIVEEMKQYLNNPEERKKEIASTYPVASSEESEVKVEEPTLTASAPAPVTNPPPAPAVSQPVAPVASNPAPVTPAYGTTDTSEDEGPAYDGKGYGLAKGTTNTYIIPGMEEMSAEEYRAKLQESISARQAKRREDSLKSSGGRIGNANSQNYLDSLSNKGENIVSDVDVSLSSSSSVQKSQAVNEDLINELRVADEIISKTEEKAKKKGSTDDAVNDDAEDEVKVSLDVEEQSNKDAKKNVQQHLPEENQSGLKAVITKMENSKAQKDLIRLSEWQASASAPVPSGKSDGVGEAEEKERYSLGQSSGYFVRNDNARRQNPILGMDPSKKYATVHDRTGSTTRRTASIRVESVFDRNEVGAIRKSPLKSQATAQSLAKTEMDQIQRPVRGSESPNYETVSGRTTVGDLRKNKPRAAPSTVSLVESEVRQRPTPGTELPKYHKIEDRRSVGDMRKSASIPQSFNPSISSLVGSEERQRPTPRTQSSTKSAADVKTFAGDLRKSSNKPLPASSAPMSLAQTEKRTRPTASTNLPPHAQVRDRRSVGDFRDPATKKPLSSPTSLAESEVRQRPTPSASLKDTGVSDSRGVVFKTKSSDSSTNTALSLISEEVRQRPTASTSSKEKTIIVFKSSPLKPEPQTTSSLIAEEVRQRPVASQGSKDIHAKDSRGVVFKSSPPKPEPQTTSSLIAEEVRQRPVASQGSKDIHATDSRGVVFKSSPAKPEPQTTPSLIAEEVRQRPLTSRSKEQATDSRGVVFKSSSSSSSSTVPTAKSLIEEEQRQRKPASTSLRNFARVEDRTGDARVAAKKSISEPLPPRPFVAHRQTRPPRASTDPRKYARVENRVGPDIRRPAKEKTADAAETEATGEKSHWWNEKTQRPRANPSKQPEALERDTQTQSSQVRKSHMKEEKLRREQETFQVPIAELQPSSLKALVKEDRHEEEEKHTQPPPLKMLLRSERPIAGVKETPQKPASKESELKALLKEEGKSELNDKRQKRPPNAGEEWWNERTKRPKGYVKHSQPIITSYENRDSHLRDYGDVVNQPGSDSTDEEDVDDEDIP
ncbi:hypothetical protein ACHAWT_008074 [Skeletonema menzelii]